MRKFSKVTLAAGVSLALAFTLSACPPTGGDDDEIKTCGGKEYNTSEFSCKGGELVGKCKGEDYYPDYQTCKNGQIEDKSSSGGSSSSAKTGSSSSSSNGTTLSSSSVKSSSSSQGNGIAFGSFTDARDGKKYKTIEIGAQIWMAENLNYFEEWVGPTRGNRCYNDKDANCDTYGRLYEWDDAIRLCPDGWHLPSRAEWNDLVSAVGTTPGKKLKSTGSDWRDGAGTDDFGFGALPGGRIDKNEFASFNVAGYWWTATENGAIYSNDVTMDGGNNVGFTTGSPKTRQHSVRCVKGSSSSSSVVYGTVTDKRDNQKYATVKIGAQTWMAENLNYAGTDDEIGSCYNNKDENCETYGRLYDWATAMDIESSYNTQKFDAPTGQHQGICPDGWHLSSRAEWNDLATAVNSAAYAAKHLKARSSEWGDDYGTDIYGFGALPGGRIDKNQFTGLSIAGYWWTTTENGNSYSNDVTMDNGNSVSFTTGSLKTRQNSVRCLKD